MIPLNQHPAGGVEEIGIGLWVVMVGSPLTTINVGGDHRVMLKEVGDLHDQQQVVVVAGEDPQMLAGVDLQRDQHVITLDQQVAVVGSMNVC